MVEEDNKNNSQGNGHKKYTIPRKKRLLSQDCQHEATIDSRESKDLINSVNNLTWEAGGLERHFTILKVYKVENSVLEREFQTKRSLMKDEGRATKELSESLAFKAEHLNVKEKEYCKEGLYCQGSNNVLGDAKMGVSLWRCPDLCLKSVSVWPGSWTVFLVVFRIVKGRVKPVTIQQGSDGPCLEPTPNYDCHIAKNIPNQNLTDLPELMNRTQYYLYEYNEEGLTVQRPRQCLPYAVIHIKKACSTTIVPEIRLLSLIDEETTIIEPTKNTTHVVQVDTKKQQYIDDGQGTMAWRGLIATKSYSLGVVAILAGHKISLKIWKSFLDVRSKIPLDNLLKVIPGDIRTAWNKPLIYRGYAFSLCTLKPCGLSDNYINFIKSLSLRDHSAALVNVDTSTVLFLLPSSKLAIELGFCEKEEPWRMFCIVRRRIGTLSSNLQATPNLQAVKPNQLTPETLNINVKIVVPNNIREANTYRTASCPVTAYNRSKSLDWINTTSNTHTKLPRRISDIGVGAKNFSSTKTPLSAVSSRCGSQTFPQKNASDLRSSDRDPTKTDICPDADSSVHLDDDKVKESTKHYHYLEFNEEEYTTSKNEKEACSDKIQSNSSEVLSNLFHVMRSKAIPFLEDSQNELTTPEQSQCNSSNEVETESKTIESCSVNLDSIEDIAESNDSSKPLSPSIRPVPQREFDDSAGSTTDSNDSSDANTANKELRVLSAYRTHKEKLIPCTRKRKFTKTKKHKDEVLSSPKQYTSQCTSTIATAETPGDKMLDSQEDIDQAPSTPPNPSESWCSTKDGIPLKRPPCLSERVREIKKLFLMIDDQDSLDSDSDSDGSKTESPSEDSETTIILPSFDGNDLSREDGSSSPMDIDQASIIDSTAVEPETNLESNMIWTNGLEVVEAMLIEVKFLQIDEEIETFTKENTIEHFEVDATSDVIYEDIVQCFQTNSPNHENTSDSQVTRTTTPIHLVVDEPTCDTDRSADGDVVLRTSCEPVEPLECSTQSGVITAVSCVNVDQNISKSTPCVTESGTNGDLSVDKTSELDEPLECIAEEYKAEESELRKEQVDNTLSNTTDSIISGPDEASSGEIGSTSYSRMQMTTPNNDKDIDEKENASHIISHHSTEQTHQGTLATNKRAASLMKLENPGIPYRYNGSTYHRQCPPPPKMRRLIDDIPRPHPMKYGYPPYHRSGQSPAINTHNGLINPPCPLRFPPQPLPFHLQRNRLPYPVRHRFNYPFQQRPVTYRCYGDAREKVL